MTRPLAEFLLRVIWMVMDYLEAYVHDDFKNDWKLTRNELMEQVVFVDLPEDEQYG